MFVLPTFGGTGSDRTGGTQMPALMDRPLLEQDPIPMDTGEPGGKRGGDFLAPDSEAREEESARLS